MKLLAPAVAALVALAPACKKKEAGETGSRAPGEPAASDDALAAAADAGPELLAEAVARRLHVDRAEASSFLWNDWNRFQENYHPLYLVDDDPATAWVEGADGNGDGEWIRLHLTPVEAATAVDIELLSGYHKSKSLFAKNGRAKKVTVTLLPSKVSKAFELEDSMTAQKLSLSQASGRLSAVELRVEEVYPGSKYADLCLSDARITVTSLTPENPAFEKAKLEEVRAWKASRLDAARLFASSEAKSLPVGTSYRVTDRRELDARIEAGDAVAGAGALVAAAGPAVGEVPALGRAAAALESGFADWVAVSVAIKKPRPIPSIDGLYVPGDDELAAGVPPREDSYVLPLPDQLELLTSSRLSPFESSEGVSVSEAMDASAEACKRQDETHHFYFRPPGSGGEAAVRELLVVQCGQVAERDGYYGYAGFQLLEYDDSGRLVATVEPRGVTVYEWSKSGDRIAGGRRLRTGWSGGEAIADRLVARR
jgi:YD repeat-containing protein